MKPILFNTEMVRAILDGRKSVTRRVLKPPALYAIVEDSEGSCVGSYYEDEHGGYEYPTVDDCPYQPGEILYVRETWLPFDSDHIIDGVKYAYKADCTSAESEHTRIEFGYKWRPSIHMPKKAARLFLRVTGVRVERLHDITIKGIQEEGVKRLPGSCKCAWQTETCKDEPCRNRDGFEELQWLKAFLTLWDSTIKKADLPRYGWDANPWVWVIEFERISKEEAMKSES